jgi:hypothetical protein
MAVPPGAVAVAVCVTLDAECYENDAARGVSTLTDDEARAELWLSELGAHVPEWRDGGTLAPRVPRYGLDLEVPERARRNAAELEHELNRARRAGRARSDPLGRA